MGISGQTLNILFHCHIFIAESCLFVCLYPAAGHQRHQPKKCYWNSPTQRSASAGHIYILLYWGGFTYWSLAAIFQATAWTDDYSETVHTLKCAWSNINILVLVVITVNIRCILCRTTGDTARNISMSQGGTEKVWVVATFQSVRRRTRDCRCCSYPIFALSKGVAKAVVWHWHLWLTRAKIVNSDMLHPCRVHPRRMFGPGLKLIQTSLLNF